MNLKERATTLKTDIPALYLALKNKETPLPAKICAWATVAYALLGYLDDLIILPVLVALTVKLIPREILEQCRTEFEGLWQNGKPKTWICALPIAALWLLILIVIVRAITAR